LRKPAIQEKQQCRYGELVEGFIKAQNRYKIKALSAADITTMEA
jgi:hypothetical protein